MVALAFEVENRVDHVLERFRTSEAAVLGDMADEQRRHVLTFGGEQELRRRLTHLSDTARRRLQLQRKNRLHGIDDDERRFDAADFLEDALEAGFGEEIQRRAADREPLAPRLDLVLRFFARAVENRTDGPRHVRRRLQQQRRLADARLPAEQDERSGYDAAAEDAIEFADAGREPRHPLDLDLLVQPRRSRGPGERIAMGAGRRLSGVRRALFDDRVPRAAVSASSEPFRRLRAALLTDVNAFRGLHRCTIPPDLPDLPDL